jgi:hypothetical protein
MVNKHACTDTVARIAFGYLSGLAIEKEKYNHGC